MYKSGRTLTKILIELKVFLFMENFTWPFFLVIFDLKLGWQHLYEICHSESNKYPNSTLLSCNFCKINFSFIWSLEWHVQTLMFWACDVCGNLFSSLFGIRHSLVNCQYALGIIVYNRKRNENQNTKRKMCGKRPEEAWRTFDTNKSLRFRQF